MKHKSYHNPKVEIRSSGAKQGRGLFAKTSIKKGELLVVTSGRLATADEVETFKNPNVPFQIEKDIFLAPFSFVQYDGIFITNHSCEPNAGIRGQVSLVAMRPVAKDEEICFDYAMSESDHVGGIAFKMECRCGSKSCRKIISDRDWRRKDLQKKYKGYFSAYLQARIKKQG